MQFEAVKDERKHTKRIVFWERHLVQREMMFQESAEDCIIQNSMDFMH